MEERSPETRRRVRLASPPLAFVGGILALAAIIMAVLLVIWVFGGFGGEGTE